MWFLVLKVSISLRIWEEVWDEVGPHVGEPRVRQVPADDHVGPVAFSWWSWGFDYCDEYYRILVIITCKGLWYSDDPGHKDLNIVMYNWSLVMVASQYVDDNHGRFWSGLKFSSLSRHLMERRSQGVRGRAWSFCRAAWEFIFLNHSVISDIFHSTFWGWPLYWLS